MNKYKQFANRDQIRILGLTACIVQQKCNLLQFTDHMNKLANNFKLVNLEKNNVS